MTTPALPWIGRFTITPQKWEELSPRAKLEDLMAWDTYERHTDERREEMKHALKLQLEKKP